MKRLKIGVLQQHNTADGTDNRTRLAAGIKALAEKGAQLIVLQELHNTLYFCQTEDVRNFDLAETIPGPSTEFFGALAKQLNVVIVISLFEKRAVGLYHNTAVVLEKDGSIACRNTRRNGLLGPVVSGSSTIDGTRWCRDFDLSDSNRIFRRR